MTFLFFATLIGLIAYSAQLGILVYLHFISSYDPVSQAISDYGVGPTKKIFSLYLWLNNIGTIGLGVGLATLSYIPVWIVICFGIVLISRTGIIYFPTDLEGARRTSTGKLHYMFALILFVLSAVVICKITALVQSRIEWNSIDTTLIVLAFFSIVSLLATVVTSTVYKKVFGLVERIFIVAISVWFIVLNAFVLFIL